MTNQGWLREGMNEEQVASILGPPTWISQGDKKSYVIRTYANGARVTFYQKKVKFFEHAAPTGHPIGTPAAPPTAPMAAPAPAPAPPQSRSSSKAGLVLVLLLVLGAVAGAAVLFASEDDSKRPIIPPPTNVPTGRPKIGR